MISCRFRFLLVLALGAAVAACSSDSPPEIPDAPDPAEVALGERLFLETRFAEFFFRHSDGQLNTPLVFGDPVLDVSQTIGEPLPGPFAGASMSCRSCHLVDELGDERRGGVRTYDDFARLSPIPAREDGRATTSRNTPPLVNASLPRAGDLLLHFDGEFPSLGDLVRDTMTGRNYGWLADERDIAIAHIARVIRADDGRGVLASDFGALPYRVVLAGTAANIPEELRLPPELRLDVESAGDGAVVDAAAALISAYVDSLAFSRDADGAFNGSPYDVFLRKNGLPAKPAQGETDVQYSQRLRDLVVALSGPRFVSLRDGSFELHIQEFVFGPTELQGLRLFLSEPDGAAPGGSAGNCIACHPAPAFTDFNLHNTGVTQVEYDEIHGGGAFSKITIPALAQRNADPEAWLPPSAELPFASGHYRAPAAAGRPERADLGLWNVYANPSLPSPQAALQRTLCSSLGLAPEDCEPSEVLPSTIALFKTPGLRSLGQSGPYFHNGGLDTLESVIDFYIDAASLESTGSLRNGAPEIGDIALQRDDVAPLAAFLRALNEDYE